MAELGVVARALLDIAGDVEGERGLGERVCRAYVMGLDVDGAAMFVAAVAEQGVYRSVHALPLRLRGEAIGTMNLFHGQPGA
ncbi:MAG: hypothetical protein M3Y48_17065, partial [Actinomycetota bacterium]|nr:hypothetical protein [Actinomycetota bacterium]